VNGVEKVLRIPAPNPALALGTQPLVPGVAVLAHDTWTALRAAAKLEPEWTRGAPIATDDVLAGNAEALFAGPPTHAVRDDGDFAGTAKHSRYQFHAEYRTATIAHATLEPPNALVRVDARTATIVAPVQNPRTSLETVQRLTGLSPDRIEIRLPRAGGGFGRFLETDYVAEAVTLAKAVGKPLKLLWTRSDAFTHDTYRPFSMHRLDAAANRQRRLVGWSHRIASTSRLAGREPAARAWLSEMHPDDLPAGLIENLQYGWYALDSNLPRGS
jgi:isoquinoline 1-oxidoreductase beta subunit